MGAALAFIVLPTTARGGGWPVNRKPSVFDTFGSSHFYNSSANDNDAVLGLVDKKIAAVKSPSRVILRERFLLQCIF